MKQRYAMQEDNLRGMVLLVLQLLMLLLIAWPWTPLSPGWASTLLLLAGIGLGVWSLSANPPGNFNLHPSVKQGARFITAGPYAHIRHPMYTALMLAGLGLVLAYEDVPKGLCWLVLVGVLLAKAVVEEKAMALRFPGYRDYAAMTGRFFPNLLLG